MKKYCVKIETPGKTIFFRNRKNRSPFTLEIFESEIKMLEAAMRASAVADYSISEITDDVKEDTWEDIIVSPISEETVVEELIEEEEPKTLLDKLLRDDKNGE